MGWSTWGTWEHGLQYLGHLGVLLKGFRVQGNGVRVLESELLYWRTGFEYPGIGLKFGRE